ncbi:ribosome small subunit-dependent GTPase A [bacterium]|nr:ribosome small subunit-dependent GTPase A [bacterium]
MKGLVSKSTGSWYKVIVNQKEVDARLRGKLRTLDLKSTNPVTVGDIVTLQHEGGEYLISEIEDRRNCIVRKSNKLSKQYQIIAANIDLAVLIITPGHPYTPMGFIDRFLVTAEAYHIECLLLINKSDLDKRKIANYRDELFETYTDIGYKCHKVSLLQDQDIELIREEISNKKVLLSGNSGVGKSTLVNALNPEIAQKIGGISKSYNKGMHTTTFAQMFQLDEDTFLIDTPGIKDFGLVQLEKQQLSHYFPEMKKYINDCKFNDCLHLEEPGCAVNEALDRGKIPPSRYISYLNMLEEIEQLKKTF